MKIEREWKSPAAALLPPTNSSIFWHVGTVVELQAKKQIVCFAFNKQEDNRERREED